MYLLDSNTCIGILNGNNKIVQRFVARQPHEIALCSVVKAELLYGAWASQRSAANIYNVQTFFRPFKSFSFDDDCAAVYGQVRAELKSKGQPIGANDLFIAATALVHDLIVVTHNTKEFSRVGGLKIEDWEV